MFVLEKVEILQLTRELAIEVCNLERVPGERRLTNQRVTHLEREIDAGLLTTFRWCTAQIKGESKIYRVNGQHTSHIFANRRKPVGTVVMERYLCDTLEDVLSLWSRFDPTISSRSKKDVLNNTLEGHEDFRDLPINQGQIALNACSTVEFGDGYKNKVTNFEKAQAGVARKDFVVWAARALTHPKCHRVGVFVAAYQTFKESVSNASVFWKEVQDGSNPNPKSPSRALERLLLEHCGGNGGHGKTGKKSLKWDQFAEYALYAWKHWLAGKDLRCLSLCKEGLDKYMTIPENEKYKQLVESGKSNEQR